MRDVWGSRARARVALFCGYCAWTLARPGEPGKSRMRHAAYAWQRKKGLLSRVVHCTLRAMRTPKAYQPQSFRFTEEDRAILRTLAQRAGVTQVDVLRLLMRGRLRIGQEGVLAGVVKKTDTTPLQKGAKTCD